MNQILYLPSMLLEICANSLTSARNAQAEGADRLELCQNLEAGGLTPDMQTLQVVKEQIDIPVYVLIRPRSGDFVYNEKELQVMLKEIEAVEQLGYPGVVVGALTPAGNIDERKTLLMMQAAGYMDVTFHRAFDKVADHLEALDCLRELGIQRILTSGGTATALQGMDLLDELIEAADDEVIIMPGGGIRPGNITRLLSLQAKEYHSAAIKPGEQYTDKAMVSVLAQAMEGYGV